MENIELMEQIEEFVSKLCKEFDNRKVEPFRYKDYILTLLFYKRVSDIWKEEYEELKEKYGDEEIARTRFHWFDIPEGCLWEDIRKISVNIGEKLNEVLYKISEANREYPELRGFASVDFNDKERIPNDLLVKAIEELSKFWLGRKEVPDDVFGKIFEKILTDLATRSGKKNTGFHTPTEIVRLMLQLLNINDGSEIYDPNCGSGNILVTTNHYLRENKVSRFFLYGQDGNPDNILVARLNLIVNRTEANLKTTHAIVEPWVEENKLKKFNFVITNPRWNEDGLKNFVEADKFGRFEYGIPPNDSADWAWIQHAISVLTENGKAAIIIDSGALYRGKTEAKIRSKVIEDDLIESVMLLPNKIFYKEAPQFCIVILNKNKQEDRKNKILVIDASDEFDKVGAFNKLTENGIRKIIEAFMEFKRIPKFSEILDKETVKENDYNLSPSLYVVKWEETDYSGRIPEIIASVRSIEESRHEVESKLNNYLEELGYERIY